MKKLSPRLVILLILITLFFTIGLSTGSWLDLPVWVGVLLGLLYSLILVSVLYLF